MEKDAKIYVAGHRGMVGSAIVRELQKQGYTNIITRTHKELDLTRQEQVEKFFAEEKPEYVFLAAAKVGGIIANQTALADFMYENMTLEMNLYISAYGSTAYAGELSADIRAGEDERGIRSGENKRTEILRISEQTVRHGLYQRDADKPVRTE